MLHDTSFYAMRSCEDNFKIPIAFTSKKKRIGPFEGLPQFGGLISADKILSGKGRLEPFLSPNTQGGRTEIRPEKVKKLLLRNCSGLHSTSSMRSPKRLGC